MAKVRPTPLLSSSPITDVSKLEYMRIYEGCKKVIEEIRPDLVILDAIFNPGLDACFMLNQKFVLNTPNTPMDVTRVLQPWLKGFWYYPVYVPSLRSRVCFSID